MPRNRHRHRRQGLRADSGAKPYYHITINTIDDRPLINTLHTGRCVIRALKDMQPAAYTIAFAVLPNRLHWLMLLRGESRLAQTVARLKSQATQRYQTLTGTENPLWHRAWDERAIREDENIRSLAQYIITSPVRAGLTSFIGHYPHWDAAFMQETEAGEIWWETPKG